jgi:membrane associated rhomboid family serine protease
VNFSFAAANKALAGLLPSASPVTYGILAFCCILYGISFLWTVRLGGGGISNGGMLGADIGEIHPQVAIILGESVPLQFALLQPWRFVTAIFLHASFLHIAFNLWGLMILGPLIEELYGSARFLFVFIFTGVVGYLFSSLTGHFSVGASGALLGLIGVALAVSMGKTTASAQMIQSQMIIWLLLTLVQGFLFRGIDNYAHFGGFAAGFVLGKLMTDRPPATPDERKRAAILGWVSAFVVIASFAMVVRDILLNARG